MRYFPTRLSSGNCRRLDRSQFVTEQMSSCWSALSLREIWSCVPVFISGTPAHVTSISQESSKVSASSPMQLWSMLMEEASDKVSEAPSKSRKLPLLEFFNSITLE